MYGLGSTYHCTAAEPWGVQYTAWITWLDVDEWFASILVGWLILQHFDTGWQEGLPACKSLALAIPTDSSLDGFWRTPSPKLPILCRVGRWTLLYHTYLEDPVWPGWVSGKIGRWKTEVISLVCHLTVSYVAYGVISSQLACLSNVANNTQCIHRLLQAAAETHWSKWQTWTQQTWDQLPLVPSTHPYESLVAAGRAFSWNCSHVPTLPRCCKYNAHKNDHL